MIPILINKCNFGNFKTLVDKLLANNHYCVVNFTDLYEYRPSYGLLTEAINNGKEVGSLIIGKEYLEYIHFEFGFASETGPTRNINQQLVEFGNSI